MKQNEKDKAMSTTKLTPLEILQRQKLRLQVKSEALADALEGNVEYVQQNFFPLLGDTATSAVMSKMPSFVQNFSGRNSWVEGFLDIAPLFLKGKTGVAARVLAKLLRSTLFR
ncbi:hypothetical protein AGMMS50262_06370 [Bacteroidia bacterium]|nr:hypothetical protein AGMMS50262_06370 [Bacteroidia bacterium]